MSDNRYKTIGERLDALVGGSGFYAIASNNRPEPRNLRILPGLILAMVLLGYILTCVSLSLRWGDLHRGALAWHFVLPILGAILFYGGFCAANWARRAGPRIIPDTKTPLDERERMLRARAGSISGVIITVLAIAGCLYCGCAQRFGWWMPHEMLEWAQLGLLLEAWALTLPVLVASWLQPADAEDRE